TIPRLRDTRSSTCPTTRPTSRTPSRSTAASSSPTDSRRRGARSRRSVSRSCRSRCPSFKRWTAASAACPSGSEDAVSIAVVGVGGAGGYFGARLAEAGHDVIFVARGAHLAAIREHGLTLVTDGSTRIVKPMDATDDLAAAGGANVVLLGVKSWQVAGVATALGPSLGRRSVVVPLQNGVENVERLTAALGA